MDEGYDVAVPADKGKGKRGRPKGSKDKKPRKLNEMSLANKNCMAPYEAPDEINYNSRQIEHTIRIHEIAKHADKKDIETLRSCFIAYLQLCQGDGFKVSNLGSYAAMGMTQDEFVRFSKKDDPAIRELVSFVKTTCALNRELLISENKLNPVIGIFWQRNYDGLRNDTEQQQTVAEMNDNYNNSNTYREKYKNLVGG